MPKRVKSKVLARTDVMDYNHILEEVVELLETGRRASARALNLFLTTTYWQIGRRIVEFEMAGKDRAEYGSEIIDRLSVDLGSRFGRGFSRRSVYQMRSFYLAYPAIVQSVIAQSSRRRSNRIVQSTIAQSAIPQFPLPWTHYVRLIAVRDEHARKFYEAEVLRGGWSVRQLDRQINTLFYERTALSRNKIAMLTKGAKARPGDAVTVEEAIKDPCIMEFLGLKDEYSESDLEGALIHHLETFLLELGDEFAFIGRQRRLRIGDRWYRVDLLFYHRRLKCLIVIDLKTDAFTHADAGQMHMYINYAKKHWVQPGENPPVGLILCAKKDASLAQYALDDLPNKILAAEYKMNLPKESRLVQEIEKTRRQLETRAIIRRR